MGAGTGVWNNLEIFGRTTLHIIWRTLAIMSVVGMVGRGVAGGHMLNAVPGPKLVSSRYNISFSLIKLLA